MSALEELRRKVKSLEDQLTDARHELARAELDACAVKVGMIVRGTGRHKGEFRVAEVDPKSWGEPWVIGNPKKADGSWGTARRHLFGNYKLVQ